MSSGWQSTVAPLVYLAAAVVFFFGLKGCARLSSVRHGAKLLVLAPLVMLAGAGVELGWARLEGALLFVVPGAIAGAILGARSRPSAPPASLAWIFALGGGAVALLGASAMWEGALSETRAIAAAPAAAIGCIVVILGLAISLRAEAAASAHARLAVVAALAGVSGALLGIALMNIIVIVAGGVGGAAGIALAYRAGEAAGQSPLRLLGGTPRASAGGDAIVRACDVEEAASLLQASSRVVLLPGFGMAAAQAQHALQDIAKLLEGRGARVTWLVHPSAGAVPGHMNIVLDEAGVSHDHIVELSEADELLKRADIVVTIGANDVINPSARSEPSSPLYGLPVPDLSRVPAVLAIKRSLRTGASGVHNAVFERPNTSICYGDAKRVAQELLHELKRSAGA